QRTQAPVRSTDPCHPAPDRHMLEGRDGPGGDMFGAIVGAMLIVYAVLAVAMVIMLPLTIIARMRRELTGDVPILDELERDTTGSRAEDPEERRQLTQVRLQTTAEAAARSHDQVLEDWVTHLQDEQMVASPAGAASADA